MPKARYYEWAEGSQKYALVRVCPQQEGAPAYFLALHRFCVLSQRSETLSALVPQQRPQLFSLPHLPPLRHYQC